MSLRFVNLHCVLRWTALAALAVAVAACQTTGEETPPPTEPTEEELSGAFFEPATYVASMQWESGPHQSLFASDSTAVWVGPDVAELKLEQARQQGEPVIPWMENTAPIITDQFIVIELHLATVFEDSSIAYDVARLRNVDLYLELPGGRRIEPLQRDVSSAMDESQEGALWRFERRNFVVFPRVDFWQGAPIIDAAYPAVRLIMEAHNTRFYFEWPAMPQPGVEPWRPSQQEAQHALQVGFTDFMTRMRRLSDISQ